MSTKANPGPFNCYAAAMPDENIFTVLARDPAYPATLAFWRQARIEFGKNVTEDDIARLAAIATEINTGSEWRERNLHGPDGEPTWRVNMQFVTDDTRPIRVENAAMEISVKDAIESALEALYKDDEGNPRYDSWRYATEQLKRVIKAIDENVPCVPTHWEASEADFVEFQRDHFYACEITNPDDPNDEDYALVEEKGHGPLCVVKSGMVVGGTRKGAVIQAQRIAKLLDAGRKGEPVAEVIVQGLIRVGNKAVPIAEIEQKYHVADKIGVGLRQIGSDLNAAIHKRPWPHKVTAHFEEFVDRINGYAAELGVYVPGTPLRVETSFAQTLAGITEDNLTPGERLIVDDAPEDLAHKPEVPMHRFSMFTKSENYAYARGLEVAPTHLPRALDAMLLDGWKLVSLFGATNSEEVGFVFERVPQPIVLSFEQTAGFEKQLKDAMIHRPDWSYPGSRLTLDEESSARYQKGHASPIFPKIEVHLEGMSEIDALQLMMVIECRMRWLPQDYEHVQIVGLIANDPEAAFDFTQSKGSFASRKTLIGDAGGCTDFGRQLEG